MRTAKPTYQSYILRKKREGEPPLSQKEWEARLNGPAEAPAKAEPKKPHEESLVEEAEDFAKGVSKDVKSLFHALKGASKAILSAIKKAPKEITESLAKASDEVHRMIAEPKYRNEQMQKAGETIKADAKNLIPKAIDAIKHEGHAAKKAMIVLGKIVSGKKVTKTERFALYHTGLLVTNVALAGATGGVWAAGGAAGKSVSTHVTAKVIHDMLADAHTISEVAEAGHGLHEMFSEFSEHFASMGPRRYLIAMLIAAEDGNEDKTIDALATYATAHITHQLSKGWTDEDMAQALSGESEYEGKQASAARIASQVLAEQDRQAYFFGFGSPSLEDFLGKGGQRVSNQLRAAMTPMLEEYVEKAARGLEVSSVARWGSLKGSKYPSALLLGTLVSVPIKEVSQLLMGVAADHGFDTARVGMRAEAENFVSMSKDVQKLVDDVIREGFQSVQLPGRVLGDARAFALSEMTIPGYSADPQSFIDLILDGRTRAQPGNLSFKVKGVIPVELSHA